MKVLHILSEWKWTGPSEPVVSLCEALKEIGVDVTIAFRRSPFSSSENTVEKEVFERKIDVCKLLRLNRYFSIKDWLYDVKNLRMYVKQKGIDIVHTHLSHDHILAVFSFLFSKDRPLILRTDHKRDGIPYDPFMAYIFSKTDGLLTYSRIIAKRDTETFLFPTQRILVAPWGLKQFKGEIKELRGGMGLKPEEKVIGVVGRLKKDRHYDLILKAFMLVKKKVLNTKLLILGRSSQIEKSILEPMNRYGVEKDVILAGYNKGDYFSFLSIFDVFVMMRAGSDGSARALREVMNMGKPVIVSDSGMLPEIVENGVEGFVVSLDPYEVSQKIEILLKDEKMRKRFGEAARQKSLRWDYQVQAKIVAEFYERLLEIGKR